MKVAGLVLVLAAMIGACASPTTGRSLKPDSSAAAVVDNPPPSDARIADVLFVQDGDSIRVRLDGQDERLRLIGINTPEQGECFGDDARSILDDLIGGKQILVDTDVEPFDQYGRILGYVWLDDLFVNAEMVRQGAALARPYEPNTTRQDVLEAAEQLAQDSGTGMWSKTACGATEQFDVTIAAIHADAPGRDNENLNGESIIISSNETSTVDLAGWTIKDESSVHRYTFGGGVQIGPGESLVVFTGCGQDQSGEFFWCNETPVWDNAGDTGFLLDSYGTIVDRYGY